MGRILIIEDDTTFRSLLKAILLRDGHSVSEAKDAEEGLLLLRREVFDLAISDLKMPGISGLELYRQLRSESVPPPFILLTAYGTIEQAVAAMKEGVADFLTKPLKDPETLRTLVRKTLRGSTREREYESLKDLSLKGLPPEPLVFSGAAMDEVRRLVNDVAPTTASVIILGESGTGKELIARTVHILSPRGDNAFVPINCAAIPENLLESELFGHEKGAFTGAVQAKRGKFELAQGGTIFLDEVGDMPLSLQAKLLRVIQERKFERVGGTREIQADIRIIAATHRDLDSEVREKRFREDLFYRLNVFPIRLPPLRERKDALPQLVDYFIRRFAGQAGKRIMAVCDEAMEALADYTWPGNIRELQNVIERSVILGSGTILLKDLPSALSETGECAPDDCAGSLKKLEKSAILKALEDAAGNRRKAATALGISKRTLQYRLKDYSVTSDE
jgi:two-component system, NtrC family, response regulator AtoC